MESTRNTHFHQKYIRSTRTWNALAYTQPNHGQLALFKSVILNYYFSSLETTFDYENPRTFKVPL